MPPQFHQALAFAAPGRKALRIQDRGFFISGKGIPILRLDSIGMPQKQLGPGFFSLFRLRDALEKGDRDIGSLPQKRPQALLIFCPVLQCIYKILRV